MKKQRETAERMGKAERGGTKKRKEKRKKENRNEEYLYSLALLY